MTKNEIFEIIKDEIGTRGIWDDHFKVGDFELFLEDEEKTIDEGKYQFGGNVYEVALKGETLFYVRQSFVQSGSYFSHQEVDFEELELVEKATKTIEYWRSI